MPPPPRHNPRLVRVDSAPAEPGESPDEYFSHHPVGDDMVNPVSETQEHVSHSVPRVQWPTSDASDEGTVEPRLPRSIRAAGWA